MEEKELRELKETLEIEDNETGICDNLDKKR